MTIAENMALADNKGKAFNLRPGTNKQRLEFYRESLRSLGLGLEDKMEHAAHIAWATGGRLVPEAVRRQYYEKSRSLG